MDRATSEVETWFPDSFLFCGKLLTTLCFFLDSFWVFSIELNWFRNDDNANDDGSSGLAKKKQMLLHRGQSSMIQNSIRSLNFRLKYWMDILKRGLYHDFSRHKC